MYSHWRQRSLSTGWTYITRQQSCKLERLSIYLSQSVGQYSNGRHIVYIATEEWFEGKCVSYTDRFQQPRQRLSGLLLCLFNVFIKRQSLCLTSRDILYTCIELYPWISGLRKCLTTNSANWHLTIEYHSFSCVSSNCRKLSFNRGHTWTTRRHTFSGWLQFGWLDSQLYTYFTWSTQQLRDNVNGNVTFFKTERDRFVSEFRDCEKLPLEHTPYKVQNEIPAPWPSIRPRSQFHDI